MTEIPSRTECCQTGVDSCDDTLSSSFLVPCRPIDLTSQEETLHTEIVRQFLLSEWPRAEGSLDEP